MENIFKKSFSYFLMIAIPVIVFMLVSSIYAMSSSFSDLIAMIADDSFYYYQVARNVVIGNGFSFDAINRTNGWHPLYMLLSIIVQWVAGPGSEEAIRLQYIVNSLLFSISGLILAYVLAKYYGKLYGMILLPLWFMNTRLIFISMEGVETPLVLMSFSLLTLNAFRFVYSKNNSTIITLGSLIAILFLSRLDTIIYSFAVGLWFTVAIVLDKLTVRTKLKKIFLLAAPMILILIVYFSFNMIVFGTLMPVSGMVKEIWSEKVFLANGNYFHYSLFRYKALIISLLVDWFTYNYLNIFWSILLYFLMFVGLSFYTYTAIKESRLLSTRNGFLFASLIGIFLILAYYSFVQVVSLRDWYWGLQAAYIEFVSALMIGSGIVFLKGKLQEAINKNIGAYSSKFARSFLTENSAFRIIAAAACTATLSFLLLLNFIHMIDARKATYNAWDQFFYENAVWMKKNLPAGSLAATWDAGMIGYFSGMNVINLDGLANSLSFLPYVRGDRPIEEYISVVKPRYIILNGSDGGQTYKPEDDPRIKGFCQLVVSCRIVYFEFRPTHDAAIGHRYQVVIEMQNYANISHNS